MDLSKDDLETLLQLRKHADTKVKAEEEIRNRCDKLKFKCFPQKPLFSQVLALTININNWDFAKCRESQINNIIDSLITGDDSDNKYFNKYMHDNWEDFGFSSSDLLVANVKKSYNELIKIMPEMESSIIENINVFYNYYIEYIKEAPLEEQNIIRNEISMLSKYGKHGTDLRPVLSEKGFRMETGHYHASLKLNDIRCNMGFNHMAKSIVHNSIVHNSESYFSYIEMFYNPDLFIDLSLNFIKFMYTSINRANVKYPIINWGVSLETITELLIEYHQLMLEKYPRTPITISEHKLFKNINDAGGQNAGEARYAAMLLRKKYLYTETCGNPSDPFTMDPWNEMENDDVNNIIIITFIVNNKKIIECFNKQSLMRFWDEQQPLVEWIKNPASRLSDPIELAQGYGKYPNPARMHILYYRNPGSLGNYLKIDDIYNFMFESKITLTKLPNKAILGNQRGVIAAIGEVHGQEPGEDVYAVV